MSVRVVGSPLVPPGTVLLINESAFTVRPLSFQVTPQDPMCWERSTWRYEVSMALGVRRTVESDPMTWGRPRGWRALLRRMVRIVGYEYRKAAGMPRCYADRSFGVVTGIVA